MKEMEGFKGFSIVGDCKATLQRSSFTTKFKVNWRFILPGTQTRCDVVAPWGAIDESRFVVSNFEGEEKTEYTHSNVKKGN